MCNKIFIKVFASLFLFSSIELAAIANTVPLFGGDGQKQTLIAAAKKKKKRKKRRKGKRRKNRRNKSKQKTKTLLLAGGGMESIKFDDAIADTDGFGGFGAISWALPVADCCTLNGGGGLRYSSLSASHDTDEMSLSYMQLLIDLAVMTEASKELAFGGFLDIGNGLTGSVEFSAEDGNTASGTVESSSLTGYGVRLLYKVDKSVLIGFQYMLQSGSMKIKYETPFGDIESSNGYSGNAIHGTLAIEL